MENQNITPIKKRVVLSTIFIIVLVITIIALLGFLGNFAVQKRIISLPHISLFNKSKVTLNTEALNLAPPIKILYSAKVTNKSNNSLTVDVTPVTPATQNNTKVISLKIGTTNKTDIVIQKPFIPYSFKKSEGSPSATAVLNLNDLNMGDFVDITLTSDLRTTDTKNLVAQKISKISEQNMLTGKVKTATESSIIVTGIVRPVNTDVAAIKDVREQKIKDYTATIDESTEISTTDQSGVHKLTLSDIKVDEYVTVYTSSLITEGSANGGTIVAALITVNRQ